MDKGLKTALYCRAALACDITIENQEAMLRKYANDNNLDNIAVYTDNGYSGANLDRPALLRLQADVEAGLVGVLLVKDISRISRNFMDVLFFLDGVKSKGVEIKFVMDGNGYDELPLGAADLRQALSKYYATLKKGAKAV